MKQPCFFFDNAISSFRTYGGLKAFSKLFYGRPYIRKKEIVLSLIIARNNILQICDFILMIYIYMNLKNF